MRSRSVGTTRFYLRNRNFTGSPNYDNFTNISVPGDIPIIGDWNGDGTDTIGYFASGRFYLSTSNSSSSGIYNEPFGLSSDLPLDGDWNGNDNIGVFRSGAW